jgi:predicted regulator of Ras-like GTPase activity (Roadblock/LC7/MglB family)
LYNKEYRKRKNQDSRKIKALNKKLKAAEGSGAYGNDCSSIGDASAISTDQQRIVAAMINRVMNASRHN